MKITLLSQPDLALPLPPLSEEQVAACVAVGRTARNFPGEIVRVTEFPGNPPFTLIEQCILNNMLAVGSDDTYGFLEEKDCFFVVFRPKTPRSRLDTAEVERLA